MLKRIYEWLQRLFRIKPKRKPPTTFHVTARERRQMPSNVTKAGKAKHPLHHAHFGTFQPVKPFARPRPKVI